MSGRKSDESENDLTIGYAQLSQEERKGSYLREQFKEREKRDGVGSVERWEKIWKEMKEEKVIRIHCMKKYF